MLETLQRHAGETRWDIGILTGVGSLATVIGLAAIGLSPSTLVHWMVASVLQLIAF